LRATTLDGEVWEARFGYVVAKKNSDQHGVMYDTLVNTVRAQIPPEAGTIHAKASAISNSPERQKIVLSNGEAISARLVVLANGLNVGLRHTLGIERHVISACHSVTLGFDVAPVGRAAAHRSPSVSSSPSIRFRFWTPWPEAPFQMLSIAEKAITLPRSSTVT